MGERRTWKELVVEGLVIVVSVLVALWGDAWWAGRQDAARAAEHLESLARDFAQMAERADSSMTSARRGRASSWALLDALAFGVTQAEADSAHLWILNALDYEVFSPSVGGYEALVASGDLELLENPQLATALAEFFGSFDDVRISEGTLVEHQLLMGASPDFVRFMGFHRIAGFPDQMDAWREGQDLPADRGRLEALARSDDFLSRLAALAMYQSGVSLDYAYLQEKIEAIRSLLPSLTAGAS